MLIFQHSDWFKILSIQSDCVKNKPSIKLRQNSLQDRLLCFNGYGYYCNTRIEQDWVPRYINLNIYVLQRKCNAWVEQEIINILPNILGQREKNQVFEPNRQNTNYTPQKRQTDDKPVYCLSRNSRHNHTKEFFHLCVSCVFKSV